MKNVLIDARNIKLLNGTGIATYAKELLASLDNLGFETNVLFDKHLKKSLPEACLEANFFSINNNANNKYRILKNYITHFKNSFGYGQLKFDCKYVLNGNKQYGLPNGTSIINIPDIYNISNAFFKITDKVYKLNNVHNIEISHWTTLLPLKMRNSVNIYTIHDTIPLKLPYASLEDKKKFYRLIKTITNDADHIITVSEHSKKDIIELTGITDQKITVTYQSISIPNEIECLDGNQASNLITRIFGLPYKEYFLFYGAIEPKKNLGSIIRAYLLSQSKTPLVIVSGNSWLEDEECKLIKRIGNCKNIIFIKYLPRHLVLLLVKGAKATLCPSIYEGFGLQTLESMSLGTCVITSANGAQEEIVDSSGLLVNPYNSHEITNAIKKIDSDDGLRLDLEKLGKNRSMFFSKKNYNQILSRVYNNY